MKDGFSLFLEDFSKSERDLRLLMDLLPVPWLLCRGWEIVFLNSMCRQVLPGVEFQDLIGRNFLDFLEGPERAFVEDHFDQIPAGDIYRFNAHIRTPGATVDIVSISRVLLLEGSRYNLVAFQDRSTLSLREEMLLSLIREGFSFSGRELYDEITRGLSANFGVNGAALVELKKNQGQNPTVTMLAGFLDSQSLQPHLFALKNDLVDEVFEKGSLVVDRGLLKLRPENIFVRTNRFEAFVGVKLKTEDDAELALFVVSRKPILGSEGLSYVLTVCGIRIAADYVGQRSKADFERQERDYRLLVEQSADAMFVVNTTGHILVANNRAQELTGLSKAELENIFDVLAEPHRPFFRGFFSKRFGVLDHSNVVIVHKSGARLYCDLSGVILSDGRIQLNVRDNTEPLMTEIALKQSEEKYRSIFNNASDGIFLSDWKTGRILDFNPSFQKLLSKSRESILQTTHFDLVQSKDRSRFRRIFEYFRKKGRLDQQPGKIRLTIQNHQGHLLPVEIAVSRLEKEGSQLIVGIIRDLSISYQAIEEHRKYLQTLTMLNVIVVELDELFNIRFFNNPIPKFGANLGADLLGRYFPDIAVGDFRWYLEETLRELLRLKKAVTIRFPCLSGQPGMDWYEADFVIARDQNNRAHIRGLIKDVTFDYIVEKQTFLMSNTDLLTSLPNRNRLEEDLFRALLRADRLGKKLAVGFIDLDRFFDVNDLLGHRLGDIALALFAERVRALPGLERGLYRWGGDQFVFIVECVEDVSAIRSLLNEVRMAVREPLTVEGQSLHITCTVGVSVYPDDAQTVDGLFGQADRAMQFGKRNGRSQYLLVQDIQKRMSSSDRMNVRNHLAFAINHGLVEPYLQPIFDVQEGRVFAMEALARIADIAEFSSIGPEVFIPVAEDLGIIEELSNLIIDEAVEFQRHLRSRGFNLRLSVNLSRRVLYSDRLIEYFGRLLRETGADPRMICIEITETIAMLDIKNASDRLNDLRGLGFRIAIDDFGTGYSTLGQLYEIPADELKIDKLFVRRIHTHEGQRIAEAIVSMARALDLDVVAEGVEDAETVNVLRNLGVRYLQGYFFSAPLSREEFEKHLHGESGVVV